MTLQQVILITAILGTLLPVVAVLIRGRAYRVLVVATLLTAAAVSLHLLSVLRLVLVGPIAIKTVWVYALVASAVPVLLASYFFSACFGRQCPDESFRDCRRIFFLMGALGLGFLAVLHHSSFVSGYDWLGGRATLYLGFLGKAFVSYLLVGIVLIGHNFEKTYRLTSSEMRPRLRLAYLGFFGILGFYTFILATGLLYSSVGLGKVVAAGIPVALAGATTAHGYLRGSVTDAATRVSRSVVYSSFTALAAGIFVLAIAAVAQVASLTRWSPDEILIVTVSFVAVLVAVLLLVSHRFQRAVRRYVDRNFYVNRYDYRAQWSRITEFLVGADDQTALVNRVSLFLTDVFAADAVTIALRNEATADFEAVHGKGLDADIALAADSPLCLHLSSGRKALLLDRKADDLAYIPIYAENGGWLDATAGQIIAPLLHAGELVGLIGLERQDESDRFTYEDVALLDVISAHVASTLRSIHLMQELAETRENQLMSQWSRMILHDLKNHLTPLRMVAGNLIECIDEPDAIETCARDLERVADRLEHLVRTLSELRDIPRLQMGSCCPNRIVREALGELQVEKRPSIQLDLSLESERGIFADAGMLRRVIENLITNAIEAMQGEGNLAIHTKDCRENGREEVHISVADTGCGIPADFIRERLFRPFATTKKKGLGLGLYQSRSIVRAHEGQLTVRSTVGRGTTFRIALRTVPPAPRKQAERLTKTTLVEGEAVQ